MGKGRINYRRIKESELSVSLFADFDRYQEVNRCWRKEDGEWVLKDIVFNEQWSDSDYRYLTECLIHTIQTGGVVFGAFVEERLKGFASVEHEFFGQEKQYLELTSIHTSYDCRNRGIGRQLFTRCVEAARKMGAKKLYISAHSCEETQAFYKEMGCVEAVEYNQKSVENEPCDCQLEFVL